MIFVAFEQLAAGLLLLLTGVVLVSLGWPLLSALDMTAGAYLIWNSIQHRDPPAGGGNFAHEG